MLRISSTKEFFTALRTTKLSGVYLDVVLNYIDENKNNPDVINAKDAFLFTYDRYDQTYGQYNEDYPAVDYAIVHELKEVFDALIAAPAFDVNAPTSSNRTPIIIAAIGNKKYYAQRLINHPQINLNHQDDRGVSAFIACGYSGYDDDEISNMLSNSGKVNIFAKTHNGTNAYMQATYKGHTRLAAALKKRMDENAEDDINFQIINRLAGGEYTAIINLLLNEKTNKNDIEPETLLQLKYNKKSLIDTLIGITDKEHLLKITKAIFENNEQSALAFALQAGRTDIHKGRYAKVYELYQTLIETRLRTLKDKDLTPEDMKLVFEFLNSSNSFKLPDSLIKTVLWKWINQADVNNMTPIVTANLKTNCKNEFSDVIEKLPDDQARNTLEKIFDNSKQDKRNRTTALAALFWDGHTNKDDVTTRLGVAYKRFRALNGEKDVAVSAFSVFVNKLARTPELLGRVSQSISGQAASSSLKETAAQHQSKI